MEDNITWQVVSRELAQKMKELGCAQEGVWWWNAHYISVYFGNLVPENAPIHYVLSRGKTSSIDAVVAHTVAELGEALGRWGKPWFCNGEWIVDIRKGASGEIVKEIAIAKTEANARAKCLIYLVENGIMSFKEDIKK